MEIETEEKQNPQPLRKPNWLVCFFKTLANMYLGGFIGKDLITGQKVPNRFLNFVDKVFCLTIKSLPIALFISYFLIILPAWVFVLAIVMMACRLFSIVILTNLYYDEGAPKKQSNEELENNKEQANNHTKFYMYHDKYYKNRPTTLIGDFFRFIGNRWFGGFAKKNFLSREYLDFKTKKSCINLNISHIIGDIAFWTTVISCFLITTPVWLFVLAIAAAASKFVVTFCRTYLTRQNLRTEIFFCKCQGEDKWHASFFQVAEKNRYDGVPECESIEANKIENSLSCFGSPGFGG